MKIYISIYRSLNHILILLSASLMFFNCTQQKDVNSLRTTNGSIIQSQFYHINISDTSKILTNINSVYSLGMFDDSLITKTDTIFYKTPQSEEYEEIFGKIDQEVIYNSNKSVKELYNFENGQVFLAGYLYDSEKKQYTKFSPSLKILPTANVIIDTTSSQMMEWNQQKKEFEEGLNTKSIVKLMKKGNIQIDSTEEEFCLYELTIEQDSKINYGEQDLILPGAVTIKSSLLYVKGRGLIAEWGNRIKQTAEKMNNDEPERGLYVELNSYTRINNEGTDK